jgi:hypothetical protein
MKYLIFLSFCLLFIMGCENDITQTPEWQSQFGQVKLPPIPPTDILKGEDFGSTVMLYEAPTLSLAESPQYLNQDTSFWRFTGGNQPRKISPLIPSQITPFTQIIEFFKNQELPYKVSFTDSVYKWELDTLVSDYGFISYQFTVKRSSTWTRVMPDTSGGCIIFIPEIIWLQSTDSTGNITRIISNHFQVVHLTELNKTSSPHANYPFSYAGGKFYTTGIDITGFGIIADYENKQTQNFAKLSLETFARQHGVDLPRWWETTKVNVYRRN